MPEPRSLASARLVIFPLALLPSACSISNADGDCNTENNCNYVVSSSAPSSTTPTDPTGSTTTATTMGGTVSGSESDGSTDSTTASTMTSDAVCGNGKVETGEDCDDGNKTPGDGCEGNCMLPPPSCGDGNVDPGEDCDDANTDNADACVACKWATCGDSAVWMGQEQCDAGAENGVYNSPCAVDCQGPGPFCGDLMVNGPEECDDGQVDPMQDGYDECSKDCLKSRYVFVTNASHDGTFDMGAKGADAICDSLGKEWKPGTSWKAWLSDDTTSPEMRMNKSFAGYYLRPDGMPIAKGWADLVDADDLLNPINVTIGGSIAEGTLSVWTHTTATGNPAGDSCSNWTSPNEPVKGRVGEVNSTTKSWTDLEDRPCNALRRLYCFED